MRGSKRFLATLAVIAILGLFDHHPARADDRRGFRPPGRFKNFDDGFRPGFPRNSGPFPGDFRRGRGPRFCWCGFDFYSHPGVHHHHDRRPGFGTFPGRWWF
ncbi:hypothetical protein [Paludisphaera mucosa]|uniref:Secreted protein n=1 Tax=Paludisphaera mucosa TaxID=3030827 RepID=A0ABT6FIU4_9BACT|nr:hypothetical protein [Paludisphaera mucosa]MDG3007472.1 hypothetical protein [Paludisphaera mucosa]